MVFAVMNSLTVLGRNIYFKILLVFMKINLRNAMLINCMSPTGRKTVLDRAANLQPRKSDRSKVKPISPNSTNSISAIRATGQHSSKYS